MGEDEMNEDGMDEYGDENDDIGYGAEQQDDDDNDYRPKGRVTSIGIFSGSGTYNDGTWFTYSNRDYVRHSDGSMGVGYGAAFNVTISGGAITNIVAYPPGSSDDLKGDGYEVGDVIYMVDATQNAGESINIDVDESKIIKATVTGIANYWPSKAW